MSKAQFEVKVTRHPKAADEWRFDIRNRGKIIAYSRNYYTRKRDAMRGALRLIEGIFQGVKITEKGK